MNRRKFFTNGSLAAIGSTIINPFSGVAKTLDFDTLKKNKKAKNIIFLVSDGMSSGTLNMADIFLNRKTGLGSNWIQLYKDNRVTRALMDTSSADSIVTDSAAGGSAWGTGFKVNNGSICTGVNGEQYLPILQKFKQKGKMVGCVTTVAITHATPSSFCVNNNSRNGQFDIALKYLDINFDVMMGGGAKYFDAEKRKDKRDLFKDFSEKGYNIVRNRDEMLAQNSDKPLLGIFADDDLPYSVDRLNDTEKLKSTPSLAEMTKVAIDKLSKNKNGFVMQIEGGKVDWGAHANDIAALINDQIAFDEAIKVAIEFAEKDKETLVIITTDHGNGNPGIIYGKEANANFDSIQKYTKTNEWILNQIKSENSIAQIQELISFANGKPISEDNAKIILSYYNGLHKKEEGLYNYKKLPFQAFSEMQKATNSVGWISEDHSADFVELAMFGPGSELLKPFVKNTDLHYLMLQAAEIENKF
ncbi:MAG: alkaline phosphatase [Flavobacterium sp.]|nr:alkaline phosphatase [Flavobacterium sp.]